MARSIKSGFGNMLFLNSVGTTWRNAARRALLVVAAIGLAGWAVTGHAANYDWTNGAGSGLWAESGNWSPAAPVTGPLAGDNLTFATNLDTLAGDNFLALGAARDAASLIFVGPTAKYLWANAPTLSSTTGRQLRLTTGISVDAGSGAVFIGNASSTATGVLSVRINADQTFANFNSLDLTFGTAPNTPYDALTGVGNNAANIGARIGGHSTSGTTTLTVNAASTGNIVFNGLIDKGGVNRALFVKISSDGDGIVYFNNAVQLWGMEALSPDPGSRPVGVEVEKGVLSIGNGVSTSAALLGTTVNVGANGQLIINRPSDATTYGLSNTVTMITGDGGLEVTGGGTVSVEAAQTYEGGTSVSAGMLQIVDGGSLRGDIAVAEPAMLRIARNTDLTMDGDISGGGGLDKTGSGTLNLTGNTTLTGGITINDGTVAMSQLNVSQLITDASPGTLAIAGAGTLDISSADGLGGLAFRLGAVDSSDLVTVSAGKLALGDELINFDDFTFTQVTGFGQGTYDLFSASAFTGSLGASLSGQIGGFDATLLLSGSSLQLGVVPEPSALVLAVFGVGAALLVWRRRVVRFLV